MWQPSATRETLEARAMLYQKIRAFFAAKKVLEVETPLLSHYGVTDRYIDNLAAVYKQHTHFLQTSPEYAMKRLLAAEIGSIYQICKAFRADECSNTHNPEFTLLEWYRIGFSHHQLMDEMEELLQLLLNCPPALRLSYQAIFQRYAAIDPLTISQDELLTILEENAVELSPRALATLDKDDALQLILSHIIEPRLPQEQPIFIVDFPKAQAALARVSPENSALAERFEVYCHGLELANGFCELAAAKEQQQRFEYDQAYRQQHGLAERQIDRRFIQALEHGLPYCSGVALGLDRVLMLKLGLKNIREVISFDWQRA